MLHLGLRFIVVSVPDRSTRANSQPNSHMGDLWLGLRLVVSSLLRLLRRLYSNSLLGIEDNIR